MSFGQAILQLLIGPLQLIFEFVFYYAKMVTNSAGLSIIILSLVVNFLLLPLYKRADAIQDEERAQQKKMEYWLKHIKKTFSGNERFMMQQTYYRQNNYKFYYALRGMLPLVLQIPFFIAAYRYLSGLPDLHTAAFGPISDLSRADGLITVGGRHVNVLPIIMTAVNLISGAIYTKGLGIKDKLQLYGMALLFLVLLYGSPAGLVIYWTMNNLFSLVKNLFMKLPNGKKLLKAVLAVLGVLVLGYTLLQLRTGFSKKKLLLLVIGAALLLPALKATAFGGRLFARLPKRQESPKFWLFFGGCIFLTILTGLLIPSAVISSSPEEFIFAAAYRSPFLHLLSAFLLAAGLFMGWLSLFYALSNHSVRHVMACLVWMACGVAIVSYMFFATELGTLSSELIYDVAPEFTRSSKLINLALLGALALALGGIWIWKKKLVGFVYPVLCLAVLGMASVNCLRIARKMPDVLQVVKTYEQSVANKADQSGGSAEIHLSRTGKNVVVLFLDRAVSAFVPYMMEEKPILKEQFAGFTYYPSTISYGVHTNIASPALYGGYEYTPEELNKRTEEKLKDKHNEALCVMPRIFDESGYEVTLIDPSYANYKWVPDLTLFDQYPNMHAYNTGQGQFNALDNARISQRMNAIWNRNFFVYGLMKCVPYVLQPLIYQNGSYCSSAEEEHAQTTSGVSEASGTAVTFMNWFSVLQALPEITSTRDDAQGCFLIMVNEATHSEALLQEPDYSFSMHVNNQVYDRDHADRFTLNGRTMNMSSVRAMKHYHVNMAVMLELGKWLDYLRENGVYDNTRIIIVSDHGTGLNLFSDWELGKGLYEEITSFNPLLMVKDFNATEFTVSDEFMTNADVPMLATEDLVEQVNPFTGKALSSEAKKASELYIFDSHEYKTGKNNGNTFIPGPWYVLRNVGDMFNAENWRLIEEH